MFHTVTLAAIKEELLKLNKGLLFLFLELLTVLVQQPSQYAATLNPILGTLHNMQHLVNIARPLQVRFRTLAVVSCVNLRVWKHFVTLYTCSPADRSPCSRYSLPAHA